MTRLGKTPAALADPEDPATGQLIETFVFAELRRQLTWAACDKLGDPAPA